MRFALVHSPVVGPATWKWVADVLRSAGHEVVVPDLVPAATSGDPAGFATAAARAVDGEPATVVVGHSGAGAVLPLIAAAMTVPPRALVFVDAGLPPATGDFVAGGGFRERLRTLARAGVLPRWSEWWEPGTFEALVPDKRRRDLIEHELPRVPLSFYDTPIAVPRGWSDAKGGYLLLSEAYRADADRAAVLGWPVVAHMGGHLDIVNDEVTVAEQLVALAEETSCT